MNHPTTLGRYSAMIAYLVDPDLNEERLTTLGTILAVQHRHLSVVEQGTFGYWFGLHYGALVRAGHAQSLCVLDLPVSLPTMTTTQEE